MNKLDIIKDKKMNIRLMSDYCEKDLFFCNKKENVSNLSNKMCVDIKAVNNIEKSKDSKKAKEKEKRKKKVFTASLGIFYHNISSLCNENIVLPFGRFIRTISSVNSKNCLASNKLAKQEKQTLIKFKEGHNDLLSSSSLYLCSSCSLTSSNLSSFHHSLASSNFISASTCTNENDNKAKFNLKTDGLFFETYDDFLAAFTTLKNYLNKKKNIKYTDFDLHATVGTGSFGHVRLVTLKKIEDDVFVENQNLNDINRNVVLQCNGKDSCVCNKNDSNACCSERCICRVNRDEFRKGCGTINVEEARNSNGKEFLHLSCASLCSLSSCSLSSCSLSSFCKSAKSQNSLVSLNSYNTNCCDSSFDFFLISSSLSHSYSLFCSSSSSTCTSSLCCDCDYHEDRVPCNICRKIYPLNSVISTKQASNSLKNYKNNVELSRIPIALKILTKTEVIRLKQVEHVKDEKNILSNLCHPFIINLLSSFQDEEKLYMLMEYINGGELFSYLRREGRLSNEQAMFYVSEIILAFQYMHSLDIVYRDLKPENLLLDSWGHIKITDFGFAKRVLRDARTYTLCGTPEYLAPEIIQFKGHSQAADWWTLGILTFEMIAGFSPFYDNSPFGLYQKVLSGKVVFPKHFDSKAKDFVKRLLVVDRSKRFGCSKNDAEDIKKHKWLKNVNWEKCYRRELKPLYVPRVSSLHDTSMYDNYSDSESEDRDEFEDESVTMLGYNVSRDVFHGHGNTINENLFLDRESFSTRSSNKFFSCNECESYNQTKFVKKKMYDDAHNKKDKRLSSVFIRDSKRNAVKYEYDLFADF